MFPSELYRPVLEDAISINDIFNADNTRRESTRTYKPLNLKYYREMSIGSIDRHLMIISKTFNFADEPETIREENQRVHINR